MEEQPLRFVKHSEKLERRPVFAVWELTLKCNQKCLHCGSRAGEQRQNELSTKNALKLVDELAELGVRELALIGGEAYLRGDWLDIVSKARKLGIRAVLQTGGYGFSGYLAKKAKEAGLTAVGVSIDGSEHVHDKIRGINGSFKAALNAINAAKSAGLVVTINTHIHTNNWRDLNTIFSILLAAKISAWQLQLTVAMGNAVDNDYLLLQPYLLDELFPRLAMLCDECTKNGIDFQAGNNIGYFGPYEHLWRGPSRTFEHYEGCQAGVNNIGIEADGTIKGCPSLSTARYTEGNIRNQTLKEIWNMPNAFILNKQRVDKLWGFCKSCYYADVCRAGCAWTSDSLLGRPGNNPFCHHRVLTLKAKGIRERIEKKIEAQEQPFGVGLFKLVEEPWST